jgi:hypothetical protein
MAFIMPEAGKKDLSGGEKRNSDRRRAKSESRTTIA